MMMSPPTRKSGTDHLTPVSYSDYQKADTEIVPAGAVIFEMDAAARQALKRSIGKTSNSFAK